jgi:hypothetical protein
MQPSSVPAMNAPHAHSPKWVPGPESSGAGRDLDTPSGTPPAVLRSGRVRLHWKLLCARTLDSTAELTAQKLRPAGGARARAQRDSESQNWRSASRMPDFARTSASESLPLDEPEPRGALRAAWVDTESLCASHGGSGILTGMARRPPHADARTSRRRRLV